MTRPRVINFLLRKLRLPNDEENVKTTIENIRSGSEMSGVSFWVLVAAIFIASLGLNTNSTAVIIGAMLVSPLMGPIMGFGMGLGINDIGLIKKSVKNFLLSTVISIAASAIYFFISPVKEAGSELLARTSPTLYDVMIAFFGGVAGIIAGASVLRRSNVIPGVAIATALMPPLCTAGYGLANLNIAYAAGAFYLFLINSVFISIATYLVVRLLNYPRMQEENDAVKKKRKWLISIIIFLLIAPSIYLTYHIVKKYFYQTNAEAFVKNEIKDENHIVVSSSMIYKPGESKLELVMLGNAIDSIEEADLQKRMEKYGLKKCELILLQGPDSRAAINETYNQVNTEMEKQNQLINNLYLRNDSLQKEVSKIKLPDSLEILLAKDALKIDTTLKSLSVKRSFSFNPKKNGMDTSWTVVTSFEYTYPRGDRAKLDSLFKKRLNTGVVNFVIE